MATPAARHNAAGPIPAWSGWVLPVSLPPRGLPVIGIITAVTLLCGRPALAFPFSDPFTPAVSPDSGPGLPTTSNGTSPDNSTTPNPDESGTGTTTPDLTHREVAPSYSAGGAPEGWTILPSLTLQEEFNDNVFQSHSDKRADFITYVQPSVSVLGNSPHLQTNLFYSPQLEYYARNTSQNGVNQQINGSALATIVEDTLYLDARAYAGVQPTLGGFVQTGFNNQTQSQVMGLSKANRTQTYSYAVSPYVLHRFGEFGTVKVGYSFAQSFFQNQATTFFPTDFSGGSVTHQTTNEEIAQFTSGNDWGRFRYLASADASQFNGTGVVQDSFQNLFNNELGYVLTRQILVYAAVGYEDISYHSVPAVNIHGGTWQVGVQYNPNEDSQITVGYGFLYGQYSVSFNGYYSLTARTRITGSYSNGIGTQLQNIQNNLNLASTDQYGNVTNSQNGAPLFIGNSLLGTQNGLYRTNTGNANITTTLDRDTLSFGVIYQNQELIGTAPGTANNSTGSTRGTSFIASWSHSINEVTTLYASASYGIQQVTSGNTGTNNVFAGQARLSHYFSPTLSGTVSYTFYRNSNGQLSGQSTGQSFTQNLVLVGLTKQF